jgi:hypothetical protein
MQEEKKLTEAESLALITEMISKVKHSYIESGIGPLSWGILITFCSLVTYWQIRFQINLDFDIWILSLLALIPQVFFWWRSNKEKKFSTHDDSMMNYVWATFAICIFLLSFYNSHMPNTHSTSLFLIMYGVPTFITGGIRKFRPMIIGGIVCWISSVLSYYTSDANNMLLMAVSSTSAWLIPGIILRRKYLHLKHV